jgi:hypothetical protein
MSTECNQYAFIVLRDASNVIKNIEETGQEQDRARIRIFFVMVLIFVFSKYRLHDPQPRLGGTARVAQAQEEEVVQRPIHRAGGFEYW